MAALSNATYGAAPVVTMTPVPDPVAQPVDGAVAELTQHADGTITAEIRIPGPAVA